jgi:putative spermidine/putrescine transport system permease protein
VTSVVVGRPDEAFRASAFSLWMDRALGWLVVGLVVTGVLFLLAPLAAVVGTSFNSAPSVRFPPLTLTLTSYRDIDPNLYRSFLTSIQLAGFSTLIAVMVAVPAALGLARARIRPRVSIAAETVLRSPLQVPELVVAVALFHFYVVLYNVVTVPLRGTFAGLAIAHILLVTPYMLVALHARLVVLGTRLEEASEGLGERPVRTFLRVTVPLMRPALVAAATLSFLVSFDNVPLSLFLGGPGASPFPVALFTASELSVSPTIYAAASVALLVSVVATFLIERFVGLRTVLSL